jgi:signal transduction histidine kinase
LPLHVIAVWLVGDLPASNLSLAASSSIPASRAETVGLVPGLQLPLDQTGFGSCLAGAQGLYLDIERAAAAGGHQPPGSASDLPPLDRKLAVMGVTCSFAAPLRAGDQTVGILHSVCTRPTGFTGEQIQMLYLVADLLGPAISNCRLFERLRRTYEELQSAQGQLIHAEKMRALGELASGMAHDFNNSLCGVLGFLELSLMDKSVGPAARNYLESARTCALDAAHTVRRVQDFARCRRKDAVFAPVDVNDLLRQTMELTRHKWESLTQARSRPITVSVEAEARALVSGNAADLREVLTNLVFNAVDAMPNGGQMTLCSWSTATDVFLGVCDTGVGISAAIRQRLFEPFFTTKGERGTGLGLSVAFGIVQSHGGEISVNSEAGKGTTITIRLPALSGAGEPETKAPAFRPGEKTTEPQTVNRGTENRAAETVGQRLRILAVEDEDSIRQFLERVLKHLGHQPRIAADATEALAALADNHFDLVFTDLGLPGMSGEELARRIAAQSPGTPIVLLTGWADQLQAEGKPLAGVSRILGKPLTISNLAEAIAAVCPKP